ncbi:hypothetical protein FZI85_11725 [Mycobacterium sp. CBMA293]|uniref:type VII secretion target n=1 Tax=unclassified Mycolicibacterium TaxID=2636767 RepID=UPI0012DD3B53|nr:MULTISPECIES: type VII secretion target [unclassified Mycolicibacterium]MUL47948.1 hypothetical protein [Mycolicibacterium sp. CBMA 360]MUL59204.1 hypothetical protein [Mycolicibacterium sp. CBMA 335]MUL70929.1 hypothetical protein [Mycolicibacterium sp. CBMA 311]MUL94572.1 hypothetical protein [Mycolicibacterium sp. CBMA 230]MUM09251.1 hypothetical protein [Mycolicibacterium sp. CBMA 213]
MGDVLKVSSEGLHVLAARCDTAAAAVTTIPPAPGPMHQATAAAVAIGYEALSAAGVALAGRATATGAKVRTAAAGYTSIDEGSAQDLAAVAGTIEV